MGRGGKSEPGTWHRVYATVSASSDCAATESCYPIQAQPQLTNPEGMECIGGKGGTRTSSRFILRTALNRYPTTLHFLKKRRSSCRDFKQGKEEAFEKVPHGKGEQHRRNTSGTKRRSNFHWEKLLGIGQKDGKIFFREKATGSWKTLAFRQMQNESFILHNGPQRSIRHTWSTI